MDKDFVFDLCVNFKFKTLTSIDRLTGILFLRALVETCDAGWIVNLNIIFSKECCGFVNSVSWSLTFI